MRKVYNVYHNLGYSFLFLMTLAFAAFYTSYLSIIFLPNIPVIHFHFIMMALWMIMLTVQPFLVKYKKVALHRLVGKMSYILVPVVLASAFLMMRHAYYRDVDLPNQQSEAGLNQLTRKEILHQVRASAALPFIWFTWFIICYSLAIINRRKLNVHAHYMLATALSLFGPIIDRIIFKIENIANYFPPETIVFLLADIVLGLLLWIDHKDKRPIKTLRTALISLLLK